MAGKILLGIVLAGYPLIIYLLLDEIGPAMLGIILIAILILRSVIMSRLTPTLALGLLGLASISTGLLFFGDAMLVLKLYPTAINLGLFMTFAYTLFYPPSMIERFVRAMKMPVHEKTVSYTRIVTMIWCCFFVINGAVATLVTLSGSLGAWTVYNGLISYAIMSTLIVAELIFRYFYKRRHGLLAHQLEARTRNTDIETTH